MWAILALPYSDSLLQQPLSRMPLSAVLVSIQHLSLSPSTPHSLHSILLPLHATLHSPPSSHNLFLPPPPPIISILSSLSLLLTSLLLSPTTHLSPPSVSPAVPDTSSVSVFSLPPATHTLRSPAGLALHNPRHSLDSTSPLSTCQNHLEELQAHHLSPGDHLANYLSLTGLRCCYGNRCCFVRTCPVFRTCWRLPVTHGNKNHQRDGRCALRN